MLKQQIQKIPMLGRDWHILQNQWMTMKLQICSGTLLEKWRVVLRRLHWYMKIENF